MRIRAGPVNRAPGSAGAGPAHPIVIACPRNRLPPELQRPLHEVMNGAMGLTRGLLVLLVAATGCGESGAGGLDAGAPDGGDSGAAGEGAAWSIASPAEAALPEPGTCPAGWSVMTDGRVSTCEPPPIPDVAPCEDGAALFVGSSGCTRVGSACPAGTFPAADELPADRPLLFVSAGAPSGGTGTREQPYGLVSSALAAASEGTVVVVGRGTYDEAVALPAGVTLRGACAADTLLTATDPPPPFMATVSVITSGGVLRDVRISGAGIGLRASGSTASVSLEGVVIEDTVGHGVLASRAAAVTGREVAIRSVAPDDSGTNGQAVAAASAAQVDLQRAALEATGPSQVFVEGEGTRVRMADVLIHRPRADETAEVARGALARNGAEVVLERAVVAGARGVALQAAGRGARLTLDRVLVRDGDPTGGLGIAAGEGGDANVRRSTIDGWAGMPVYIPDGTATLTDVVIRDATVAPGSAQASTAIAVVRESEVELVRVAILRSRGTGLVVARPGARVVAEDLFVAGTEASAVAVSGQPFWVIDGGELELHRAELVDNEAGPIVASQARANLSDLVVNGTRGESTEQLAGIGLLVSDRSTVHAARTVIEETRVNAIVVEDDSSAELSDLVVRQTRERSCSDGCQGETYGSGLVVMYGGYASLERFRIEANALCGVRVLHAGAMDLFQGEIVGNPIGANIEDADFDASRIANETLYDNERNLARRTLPEPMTALPQFEG